MVRRLVVLAALATGACELLEDPVKPIASLSAFQADAELIVPSGEARTLAVQALDEDGKPVNGVSVIFVRGEPHVFDFETKEIGTATLYVTTATATAFGIKADGLAVARVRLTPDAGAKEGDIYTFARTSAGADAAANGLVVRFRVKAELSEDDAGASDAGAGDAGGEQ